MGGVRIRNSTAGEEVSQVPWPRSGRRGTHRLFKTGASRSGRGGEEYDSGDGNGIRSSAHTYSIKVSFWTKAFLSRDTVPDDEAKSRERLYLSWIRARALLPTQHQHHACNEIPSRLDRALCTITHPNCTVHNTLVPDIDSP